MAMVGKVEDLRLAKDDWYGPVYKDQFGNKVHVNRITLDDFMMEPLRWIENLVKEMGDDAYESFGFPVEALLEWSTRRVEVACNLLTATVGYIGFDILPRDEEDYNGTLFFVAIKLNKGKVETGEEEEGGAS